MKLISNPLIKNIKQCMSKLFYNKINYFSATDYNILANFSPELIQLQETVRKFANEKILPLSHESDVKGSFPQHLWKEMGDLGLLGITVPSQFGGSDLTYVAHCMVMEELSRVSGGIALSYGAHSALCTAQIERHGNNMQKLKYLPQLCSGTPGALAMSESNSGSDVTSMKSFAQLKGDKYILNGSKMWITNGVEAKIFVIYAKTLNLDTNQKSITAFIVERDFPGFKVAQKLDKFGMRNSNTSEIVFENVEIPKENILGQLNKGVYVLMSGLDYERLVLSGGPIGLMQAALETSIKYCQEREQFGQKIGEFQLVQGKLAKMYTLLNSCRAYMYALAHAADKGKDCASLILQASQAGEQVTNESIQILGGNGYINEFPCQRYFRDAKLYSIGAGTNEIRKWLIGRQLFSNKL